LGRLCAPEEVRRLSRRRLLFVEFVYALRRLGLRRLLRLVVAVFEDV